MRYAQAQAQAHSKHCPSTAAAAAAGFSSFIFVVLLSIISTTTTTTTRTTKTAAKFAVAFHSSSSAGWRRNSRYCCGRGGDSCRPTLIRLPSSSAYSSFSSSSTLRTTTTTLNKGGQRLWSNCYRQLASTLPSSSTSAATATDSGTAENHTIIIMNGSSVVSTNATGTILPTTHNNITTTGTGAHSMMKSFRDVLLSGAQRPPYRSSSSSSWMDQLSAETEENLVKSKMLAGIPLEDVSNRHKRPVLNGHYVCVPPTGLPQPRLRLFSPSVAYDLLQLSPLMPVQDDPSFLEAVSGNLIVVNEEDDDTNHYAWATPYALSIMGTRYTSNCPFGTGHGYGDGRALSIGEIHHYELQLKGGGTTPFCRGGDGRAVLRSSLREFLASEAMHCLHVPTTRALALVSSETETTQRPWYRVETTSDDTTNTTNNDDYRMPTSVDDPRFVLQYPDRTQRKRIVAQLRATYKDDPDRLVREPVAITTRVSRSFVRIGHIDLFARRVMALLLLETPQKNNTLKNAETCSTHITKIQNSREYQELEQMIWHACYRDFRDDAYTPFIASRDLPSAATVLLEQAAQNIATMVAHWMRIGFCQGNFNADNCLLSGCTMDYGPFGFMEEYHPLFAKWTGSGSHFAFANQPKAGLVNYQVLVESVAPIFLVHPQNQRNHHNNFESVEDVVERFVGPAAQIFVDATHRAFLSKLGFVVDVDTIKVDDTATDTATRTTTITKRHYPLWQSLEALMQVSRVDWTLFFRQLTHVARELATANENANANNDSDLSGPWMLQHLQGGPEGAQDPETNPHNPFYERLDPDTTRQFEAWLVEWKHAIEKEEAEESESESSDTHGITSYYYRWSNVYERMRTTNPKYVLREWMLVQAYTDANAGLDAEMIRLHDLIQRPYDDDDEEDGKEGSNEERYYRRASRTALRAGGTAFMSCSS